MERKPQTHHSTLDEKEFSPGIEEGADPPEPCDRKTG